MSAKYPLIEEARSGAILMFGIGIFWITMAILVQGLYGLPLIRFLFNPSLVTAISNPLPWFYNFMTNDVAPWVLLILGISLLAKTESEVK